MDIISVLLTSFFTVITTSSMLYIALVTGIGPWVAPVVGLVMQSVAIASGSSYMRRIAIITTVTSSIGGITATAFGFSFPTWFFLDKVGFNQIFSQPLYAMMLVASFVLLSGIIAHMCLYFFYDDLVVKQGLSFPMAAITHASLTDENPTSRRYLFSGIVAYGVYALISCKRLFHFYAFPATYTLLQGYSSFFITVSSVTLDFSVLPLLLAIGFIAGSMMAVPLLIGIVIKSTVISWIHHYYMYIHEADVLVALCSGIVLSGTVGGLYKQLISLLRYCNKTISSSLGFKQPAISLYKTFFIGLIFILFAAYFYYYEFSLVSITYLFVTSIICAYQMTSIAGKIGLALLGRFATFVMVPGIMMFGWNPLQITLVATAVELVGGMLVDLVQSRKALEMSDVSYKEYRSYFYVALLMASLATAYFFYYYVNQFELGSSVLCAQRAQARALLLQATHVNFTLLGYGVIIGLFLKVVGCNPILVLSGLLMPFSLLVPLVAGAFLALMCVYSKRYEPFFSGLYIANACASVLSIFL